MCHTEREYLERECNSHRGRKDRRNVDLHLEIVSTLQRSRTTFTSDVKNGRDLNLPLEQKINYHEYL